MEGEHLPRRHWTLLNRLQAGVGRFKTSMKEWGLAESAACECGEAEQTAEHIITTCPLYRPPLETGLVQVVPETVAWLCDTVLDKWTYEDDTPKKKKKPQNIQVSWPI